MKTYRPYSDRNPSLDSKSPSTPLPLLQSGAASNPAAMAPNAIGNVGGSQAHPNMQPFLALNFCIALQGIFPSPT